MKPDIGNLFKFFKKKDYAINLINNGLLHFQNPAVFEKTIGEVNIGYRKGSEPFRLEHIGVSCFTHSNDCWKNNDLWNTFSEGKEGILVGFQEVPSKKSDWLYHQFEKDTFVILPHYTNEKSMVPPLALDSFPDDGLYYIPIKSLDHKEELEYRLCVFEFQNETDFVKVEWSSHFYPKSIIFHRNTSKSEMERLLNMVNCSRPLRFWKVEENSLRYLVAKVGNNLVGEVNA